MKFLPFAALAPLLLAGCASFGGPSTDATAATTKPVIIRCTDGPDLNAVKPNGRPEVDEAAVTQDYERQLISAGIPAHQTRFWNGCLETFVKVDGKDVMKFYDPGTLKEVGS
jgi:hypothetical protein